MAEQFELGKVYAAPAGSDPTDPDVKWVDLGVAVDPLILPEPPCPSGGCPKDLDPAGASWLDCLCYLYSRSPAPPTASPLTPDELAQFFREYLAEHTTPPEE